MLPYPLFRIVEGDAGVCEWKEAVEFVSGIMRIAVEIAMRVAKNA